MGYLALAKLALDLINAVVSHIDAERERERGLGRTEAVAAGLQKATASIATARQVEAEAEEAHRADPTDAAFDPEFRRDR